MIDLPDIIGQDQAIAQLRAAREAGRESHAMIFAGPEGVGRETTALAWAKLLLCEHTGQPDALPGLAGDLGPDMPCNACPACRLMDEGTHPDCHVIYKELARYHDDTQVRNQKMQNLAIGVISQFLIGPANRAAVRRSGKVFIVREAELLSREAQNSFLKTLEEPPPGVRIILVCSQPEQLLPTTRSRCAMIRFVPLPDEYVAGMLRQDGASDAEAICWARLSGGSIGKAQHYRKLDLYDTKRELLERLANAAEGSNASLAADLAKLSDTLANQAVDEVKEAEGAELAKSLAVRQATAVLMQILASPYRDAMSLAIGTDRPLIHADQPQVPRRLAEVFSPSQLGDICQQIHDIEGLLWRNANAKVLWDNMAVTFTSAAPLWQGGL